MVSPFAAGPYAAFPSGSNYLCRYNFRGWTFEGLADAFYAGFASFNGNCLWEQSGGAYRVGELVFQSSGMLRSGLNRIGKPFRGWGRSEKEAAAETRAADLQDIPAAGEETTREMTEARRANSRSMAVHDMKSSLVLLGGFIQRLSSCPEADPDRQRQYLEIIKKEGCKLEALLDEFLSCTELTDEMRLDLKPACLGPELHELCEANQLRAAGRNLVLELDTPSRLSPLIVDMRRLQRVFGNLLDNAIKFSPLGGTILVTVQESGKEIRISFADDGPGMDARDLPYLFDAHYRGRTDTEGSGLGLATVKAIVEAHGGRVLAENRMKRGAVFTVILPRRECQRTENVTWRADINSSNQQGNLIGHQTSAARQL